MRATVPDTIAKESFSYLLVDGKLDRDARQTIYDHICAHMRAQGCKSKIGNRCSYRSYRGGVYRACAIGSLITESSYNDDIECRSASHKDVLKAVFDISSCEVSVQSFMLAAQQDLHDNIVYEDFESSARNFASLFELEYKP